MRILAIDAWAEDEFSWSWNNWFHVGNYEGNLTKEEIIKFFFDEYFTVMPGSVFKSKDDCFLDFKKSYYIDDDQYNMVIKKLDTDMPIYAIEYGNLY